MEFPTYRFPSLERHSKEDVKILNKGLRLFAVGDQVQKILKSTADTFLAYDICNIENIEISFLVRPVGIGKPQFHRLPQPLINFGRTNDNTIALKSPLVSKKHAQVFRRGIDYFLRDLNSNNGTYLNQVKLNAGDDVILRNDDVIKIEPFEIVIGLSGDLAKEPLQISLSSVRVCHELKSSGQAFISFQLQPSQEKGILLLDQEVARWMVRKILTGQKEAALSTSTEIEKGVLEYLASKIMSTINPLLQDTRLTLLSIEQEKEFLEEWLSDHKVLLEMTIETRTEIGMIYAKAYLPERTIHEKGNRASVNDFLKRSPWMRNLQYSFSVHLGVSHLPADQIPSLEQGDIILLDRSQIVLESGRPKGEVELRCHQLRRGAISGSLLCDENGKSKITVVALYQEGLKGMSEATKKSEAPQAAGANEPVLSNLEVPVIVELARLNLTLDEVASLQEGQIIEMEKSDPELVDLSVEGKIIASGKLVDVEGKLGVSILKIIKGR